MIFLEFSATDFAEYENENRVIQLLTILNTLSVKWEGSRDPTFGHIDNCTALSSSLLDAVGSRLRLERLLPLE